MRRDPSPSLGDLPNMEYLDPSISEGFPGDSVVKNPPSEAGDSWVQSLHQEDPLEKEIATHCSLLAWRIPGTEEPGGLQSMGSQRVGQRLSNFTPPPPQAFLRLPTLGQEFCFQSLGAELGESRGAQ